MINGLTSVLSLCLCVLDRNANPGTNTYTYTFIPMRKTSVHYSSVALSHASCTPILANNWSRGVPFELRLSKVRFLLCVSRRSRDQSYIGTCVWLLVECMVEYVYYNNYKLTSILQFAVHLHRDDDDDDAVACSYLYVCVYRRGLYVRYV